MALKEQQSYKHNILARGMSSDLRGNISGAEQHPQQPGGAGN